MGRMTTEGMIEVLRGTLLNILQMQTINLAQINLITNSLHYIALIGNDDEKKIACRYLLVTRTNLPYASQVRARLADYERNFRAYCAPLLDKLSAFMPSDYVEDIGQENQLPAPTK